MMPTAVVPREGGGSSTPRLFGSIATASRILDHPPSRVMTTKCATAFSRLNEPEFCIDAVPPTREQGMPGACCTRDLVCNSARGVTHTSIQVQSEHSGIPCAMALRLIAYSPRRTALLPPSSHKARAFAQLDASTATSGPHAFAVRFMRVRLAHSTSTASHRTFVTIAKRPSFAARRAEYAADLPDGARGIFFGGGMDRF
jgi:hypothetical protein